MVGGSCVARGTMALNLNTGRLVHTCMTVILDIDASWRPTPGAGVPQTLTHRWMDVSSISGRL